MQVSGSGLAGRRRRRAGDRGFSRRELSLFAGAYVVYNAARWLFTGDLSQARWHAESIMRLERELGLAVEASVQQRLDAGLWSSFFSYVYMAAQLVVLPCVLVWLYRRAPGVYRPLRNTVIGTWLIAIPIYAIFPVAPPRLADAGIVDAVSEQAGFALTGRSTLFFNPLAAVPSLHVGFAFAIGIAAAAALRAPAARALALSWGPLVSLSVLVTGNHYVFDIAAGLVVTAIGYAVTRPVPRRPGVGARGVTHGGEVADPGSASALLVLVNAHASGIADPEQTGRDLVALLEELGAGATSAVTSTERELWDCLRAAAGCGYRVVLVGGDGSLHAAANAPLASLPELAIIPAGRANNIARALGIPSDRPGAVRTAAFAPARPLDALLVRTPERSLYALEAVSAGFQAEARARYSGENSADLRQGLRALVCALRRYEPYGIRVRVDGCELGSSAAAQLFLSNLRYFGHGFDVVPGADPEDGRLDAILLDAPGRLSLLRLLAATRRGRHLTRAGVRRLSGRCAQLTEPLPLVADAIPLGTTTASVSVEPARLSLAVPASERQPRRAP
jgi:diacylglycerol kinase family enzyme/membrane-associated phospholipid phosphatase